jgi:hypothetical protein
VIGAAAHDANDLRSAGLDAAVKLRGVHAAIINND